MRPSFLFSFFFFYVWSFYVILLFKIPNSPIDLTGNLFLEPIVDHQTSPTAPLKAIEEVLIKIPGDLTVFHLRQGDDVVAVLACVADEIQWPLVKDEAGGEDREDTGWSDSTYAYAWSDDIGCRWWVSKLNNGRTSGGSPPKSNLTRSDCENPSPSKSLPRLVEISWSSTRWRSRDLRQVFLHLSSSPLLPVSTETNLPLWTTDSTRFISSLWLTAGHVFYHLIFLGLRSLDLKLGFQIYVWVWIHLFLFYLFLSSWDCIHAWFEFICS